MRIDPKEKKRIQNLLDERTNKGLFKLTLETKTVISGNSNKTYNYIRFHNTMNYTDYLHNISNINSKDITLTYLRDLETDILFPKQENFLKIELKKYIEILKDKASKLIYNIFWNQK